MRLLDSHPKGVAIDLNVLSELSETPSFIADLLEEKAKTSDAAEQQRLQRRARLYRREASKVLRSKHPAIERAWSQHESYLDALYKASESGLSVERPFKYEPKRIPGTTPR